MTRKESINRKAEWNETTRKLAKEEYGKAYKYLSAGETKQINRLAWIKLNNKE